MRKLYWGTLWIVTAVLLGSSCAFSQSSNSLQLKLGGVTERHLITLFNFSGIQMLLLDSARTDVNGTVLLDIPESTGKGILRIYLGSTMEAMRTNQPPMVLDVIYAHNDIQLSTYFFSPIDSLKIGIKSDFENHQFLSYQKERKKFEIEINSLSYALFNSAGHNDSKAEDLSRFRQYQVSWTQYEDSLIADYPDAWFTRIVRANKFPFVDPSVSNEDRVSFLKQNFFNSYIFNDPELLKTNIIEERIISYVQMYFGQGISDKEQDDQFIKAIDIVLAEASKGDPEVYAYVLNNLIAGFEIYGRVGVLDYLNAVYGESGCESNLLSETSLKRLASVAKNAVGKTAANIKAIDLTGSQIELSTIESDFTLVVFWASWCDHCRELIPEIRTEMASNKLGLDDSKTLTTVAISLDENEDELNQFLSQNDYSSWIMVSDFKRWDGEIVKNYNVYATPTIFVLDKEKKIIAKPNSINELKRALTGL